MSRVAVTAMLGGSSSVGVGLVASVNQPARAATCSVASTGRTVTRTVNGRPYLLNVPAGLTGPSPLLLSLHGGGEPTTFHEAETGWDAFAASNHFIVAYPEAVRSIWNFAQGSPDVTYLRDVVADISGTWCVDPSHVHAEGYSNGGSMTNRLACDANDLFASVSSYAGSSATITGSPCTPARPVSIAEMDSYLDPIQPFEEQARFEWVRHDSCTAMAFEFSVLAEVWHHRPCAAGTEVLFVDYYAGSHNWPIGPANSDIRDRIWALFKANPRP
jgi:polyhydroxybutyrate depolymerase